MTYRRRRQWARMRIPEERKMKEKTDTRQTNTGERRKRDKKMSEARGGTARETDGEVTGGGGGGCAKREKNEHEARLINEGGKRGKMVKQKEQG